jgi:hypothetical protein
MSMSKLLGALSVGAALLAAAPALAYLTTTTTATTQVAVASGYPSQSPAPSTPTPPSSPSHEKVRVPAPRLTRRPPSSTHHAKVTFRFTDAMRRVTYQCRTASTRFMKCSSPWHLTVPAGYHVVYIRARWHGITSKSTTYKFRTVAAPGRSQERARAAWRQP